MTDTKPMSALDEAAHIHDAFVMLPTEVLSDAAQKRISPYAVVLYSFLLFWEGANDKLWYNVETMARETGVHETTVSRALEDLRKARHIRRTRRMGASWLTKCLSIKKGDTLYIRGKSRHLKDNPKEKLSPPPVTPWREQRVSDDAPERDGSESKSWPRVSREEAVSNFNRLVVQGLGECEQHEGTSGEAEGREGWFEPKEAPAATERQEDVPTVEELAAQKEFADSLF